MGRIWADSVWEYGEEERSLGIKKKQLTGDWEIA